MYHILAEKGKSLRFYHRVFLLALPIFRAIKKTGLAYWPVFFLGLNKGGEEGLKTPCIRRDKFSASLRKSKWVGETE